MKKRLISMLLIAVLAVSLLAGYSLSANAETVSYSTMTYQMQSGDYVLRICQRLGLNYYTCKTAIMKLNNITDNQWNKLAVGKVLTLPATDADAIVIASGHGSTMTATSTATAATTSIKTPVATVSTATTTPKTTTTKTQSAIDTALSKDTCWWYMVPYKLAMGETVTDACNALGVSYKRFKDTIQKINKISNWNSIPAGTTLWIPSVAQPAKGTNCIIVYRHMMKSGETAYGVVSDRGLDYNAIKPMLQILNEEHSNLAKIKAGDPFYYPVATTIALPSDTTSNNKTTTTKSDGTVTVVQTYKLTSAIDTGAANVEFYVNGKQVKEAKAGDTVNVSINTKAGRAAKNVRVKYANGQADLLLKSFSFTMPSCDIQIDADIMKGHKITVECNYIGKAATLVDGVSMNSAATGAAVMVTSLDPSLAITEVYVSYKTLNGVKREALTNIDQGFIMPDADVKVEITLDTVQTYAFYVVDVLNGSYSVQVNGNNVTKAAKGATVTIVPKPNEGYVVGDAVVGGTLVRGIMVRRHDNLNPISAFNNTFTMPAADVDVVVNFIAKGNNPIVINPVQGGQFYATVNNPDPNPNPTPASIRTDADREAPTNARVYLNWLAENAGDASYAMVTDDPNAYIVTRNSDGLRVPVSIDDDGNVWFRMPVGGVTVTGGVQRGTRLYTGSVWLDEQQVNQFQDISLYLKADSELTRNEYQVTNDGTQPHRVNIGEYVNVSYNVSSKNIVLDRYEIWVGTTKIADLTSEVQKNSCFQVPTFAVGNAETVFQVRAYFTSNTVKLASADKKVTGVGTVGMATGPDADGNYTSVSGVKAGEPFWISVAPAEGYIFDAAGTNPASNISSIHVYRKDTGGEIPAIAGPIPDPLGTGTLLYGFGPMPADGVTVEVVFEKLGYVLNITTIDENFDPITGGSYVKITRNKTDTVIDNYTTTMNVEYGDTITVALTEAGKSEYTFVQTDVNSFISKHTSFKVTGDVAANPTINLIIMLKSKSLTTVKNPIKLNLSVNDSSRGNAECMILDSPSGLSTLNTFTNVAYAGDLVAIIPDAAPGYYTDPWNIYVKVDSGHQDLATTTVDGKTAYTFTMPQKDYKNIKVNFVPIEYELTLNVLDQKGDPVSLSYVKVTYSAGGSDADVLPSGNNFKPIPYGSTVKINLTNLATKLGVTMDKASFTVTPPNLITPGNKTVTNTIEDSGNGKKFVMPNGNCTVTVKLNNVPAGIEPDMVTLPATADLNPGTLKLKYVKENGETVFGGDQVESGTKLKVIVDEDLPTQVLDGPITFLKGTTELAQAGDGEFFTVPANPDGTGDYKLTASAKLATKQYKVQIVVENAPDDAALTISVGGGATATLPVSGMTLAYMVPHGKNIKIENTDSSDPAKFLVDGLSASTDSPATSVDKPLAPEGKNNGDTVVLTVKFETKKYKADPDNASITFHLLEDCTDTPIPKTQELDEGTTIYVKGTPSGDVYVTSYKITVYQMADPLVIYPDENGIASFELTNHVTGAVYTYDTKSATFIVTFTNVPSRPETAMKAKYGNDTKGTEASTTFTGKGSDGKDVIAHIDGPSLYTLKAPDNTSKFSLDTGSSTTPTNKVFKINWANVKNNDTVEIEVEFVPPKRQLTADHPEGLIEYYSDAKGENKVAQIDDGEQVWVKVGKPSGYKYVSAVKVLGTRITDKNTYGLYGPFTITKDVTTYNTDIDLEASPKTLTLNFVAFDYDTSQQLADASTAIQVEVNGSASSQLSFSGVKDKNAEDNNPNPTHYEVKAKDGYTLKDIIGQGVSSPTAGKFDVNFGDYDNLETVTIKVYVQAS